MFRFIPKFLIIFNNLVLLTLSYAFLISRYTARKNSFLSKPILKIRKPFFSFYDYFKSFCNYFFEELSLIRQNAYWSKFRHHEFFFIFFRYWNYFSFIPII